MRQSIRAFIALIALGIGIVSVTMTFSFGMAFADGVDSYIYAALFAALDAAKFALPSAALYLTNSHARRARFWYLFFALLSMSCHIGLTLTVKDRETGDAKSAHTKMEDAKVTRDALKTQIADLGKVRSKGDIGADLAISERDPIFTDAAKSAGCVNDTALASRTHCDAWRKLRGEWDKRAELDRLTGELKAAQERVDGFNTGGAEKRANILAATLAKMTGADEWTVLVLISIIMAVAIEGGSSKLMEFAAAMSARPEEPVATGTPASEPTPDTIPAPLVAQNDADTRDNAAEPSSPTLPVMCPKEWVASRMQGKRSASLSYDDTLALYQAEAAEKGMSAVTANAFSRALTGNGYDRKRPGGKTMILGAVLKEQREVGSLRVVK